MHRRDGPAADRVYLTRAWPGCCRSAFTITELLIVIAILSLLIAMLMPALRGARSASHRTNEMSAVRQLLLACNVYAYGNRDAILPGYKSGLRAVTADGQNVAEITIPVAASRYPWRIASFLNYDFRALYKNSNLDLLEDLEYTDPETYHYMVSLSPSLAMNTTWVGGDEQELGFSPTQIEHYGRFYVSRYTEVIHPGRLLMFVSGRGVDPLDTGGGMTEGFFRLRSPRLLAIGDERWTETYHEATNPGDFGNVSIRYGDQAVTGFVDGHVGTMSQFELHDMRYWANRADSRDYGLQPIQEP